MVPAVVILDVVVWILVWTDPKWLAVVATLEPAALAFQSDELEARKRIEKISRESLSGCRR